MCDVLYCRAKPVITVLEVSLCEKHYLQHCDGKDLNTKKGLLTFRQGATVVMQEGDKNMSKVDLVKYSFDKQKLKAKKIHELKPGKEAVFGDGIIAVRIFNQSRENVYLATVMETESLKEWRGNCPKCGNCNHEEIDYQHDARESLQWLRCCDCNTEFRIRKVSIFDGIEKQE